MAERRTTGRYVIPQKRVSGRSTTSNNRDITVRDVQVNGDKIVLPSGTEVIASYNWSSTSTTGSPRIIVPGAAPVFVSPGDRKFTLNKEYDDPLAGKIGDQMHPFSSFEPLFNSVKVCSPDLDMDTIDIITARNSLKKLLLFCGSPGGSRSETRSSFFNDEQMKFFVHGIGKNRRGGPTLVFTRDPWQQGSFHPGFGQNFEKELTEMDPRAPPDSETFRTIAKINLDGISLLVRSEVDACEPVSPRETSSGGSHNTTDELSEQLENLVVSSESKKEVATPAPSSSTLSSSGGKDCLPRSRLTSTKSGVLLGNESRILELKTQNSKYAHNFRWKQVYWQMALGGAHKLVLGLHDRGHFDSVQEFPIDEVKAQADRTGSTSMVYLANTLREVIKAAHRLMAAHSSNSRCQGQQGVRAAVVVEHSPPKSGGNAPLRVRLAVHTDRAVAP